MTNSHEASFLNSEANRKNRMSDVVNNYLDGISELGLVGEVLWGVPKEEDRAYVVNVFRQDVNPASAKDPRFSQLTSMGGKLERDLAEDVLVRVSYLNPFLKEEFLNRSEKRQFSFHSLGQI